MNRYDVVIKDVYAIGDLHGYFESLMWWIKQNDLSDCAIIICGDVGFGFEKERYYLEILKKFDEVCSSRNVYIFAFRGNHDDPSYFDGKRIVAEHFISIPDYSVINVIGENGNVSKRILCVGGAISVDRTERIKSWDDKVAAYAWYSKCSLEESKNNFDKRWYWEDEPVVYNESELDEIKEKGLLIDVVCTHTCPSFCDPVTKDGLEEWINKDQNLSADIDREREDMDKICSKLIKDGHPVKKWVYGHYHRHNNENIDGVEFVMLDMYRVQHNKFDFHKL